MCKIRIQIITLVMGIALTVGAADDMKSDDPDTIRRKLTGPEFDERRTLVELGEKIFPAFDTLLKKTDLKPMEVVRIYSVIEAVKSDRSRFYKGAQDRLSHESPKVRLASISLIEKIGNERDTKYFLVLLSDSDITVAYRAGVALSHMGDDIDLAAMDLWLKNAVTSTSQFTTERANEHLHLVKKIKECRDELRKQINKNKKQNTN